MKLAKLLFWRKRSGNKERKSKIKEKHVRCEQQQEDGISITESEKEVKPRPRSSSFNGIDDIIKSEKDKEKEKAKKVKRSASTGHKTSRKNSFIRWYRRKKEIGKALRDIGDDLDSNHSSNLSLNKKAKK